jgi:hypothetical protein
MYPSNPTNDKAWAIAQFIDWAEEAKADPVQPNKVRTLAHYRQMATLATMTERGAR